jgi:hypothetical protein
MLILAHLRAYSFGIPTTHPRDSPIQSKPVTERIIEFPGFPGQSLGRFPYREGRRKVLLVKLLKADGACFPA